MRVDQITFTRFIAAISIVVYHFGLTLAPFNNEHVSFLFSQANIGVSYFFVLSGFVMIIAYGGKPGFKISDYYRNRIARIYPVYLLAILMLFTFRIIFSQDLDISGLFLNVLAIQAWIPGKALSFNGPGWSLSVEFVFYAIFPFLVNYCYRKWDLKTVIFQVCIFWLISQLIFHLCLAFNLLQPYPSKSQDLLLYFPLFHLNEFLAGNLTGLIFLKYHKNLRWNLDLFVTGLFILLILAIRFKDVLSINYHDGALALVFAPFIFVMALNRGFLTSIFSKRLMVFLGEISYGIYIYQFPLYYWSAKVFKFLNIGSPVLRFYMFLIFLILLSALSYIYIESPLRSKLKGLDLQYFNRVVKVNI
jgi:peptidoglycan/LPS O-acetylase OafA/YrhL